MAIRVICPGCMTTFEVGDQFAGKKGPCPKCGHIIEIPKERIVVHAPDEVVVDGKRTPKRDEARPILQNRFIFTGKQVALGAVGVVVAAALAFVVGLAHSAVLSGIVGFIGAFGIAFPIAEFGYMLIRDDDDLEMFLGNERHKRSLFAALVFGGSWIVFELFLAFLGSQGPFSFLYFVPIAVVGSFGALIFFDCNFGRALLVYLIFAFAAFVGRGLLYQPQGWVWLDGPSAVANFSAKKARRAVERSEPVATETENPESTAETSDAAEPTAAANANNADSAESAENSDAPKETKRPKLSKDAPKPNLNRRR